MKRTRVQNFAAQNAKKQSKLPALGIAKANAESLRDMFVRMIIVVSEKTAFDLRKIISYPITTYPLSLAHCDGSHMKTEKSSLLRKLKSLQTQTIKDEELPTSYMKVYDGGLLLHSVLLQTAVEASYASMARAMICHEEADTLIAFHIANITADNVIVRASDTDILVILIGVIGQESREDRTIADIIMDCGMGNSRRYINDQHC